MSDMASQRLEPTARLPDRNDNGSRREPGLGRRLPPPPRAGSTTTDVPEVPRHQVDSLA